MGTVSEFAEETIFELERQKDILDSKGKDIKDYFENLLSENSLSFCSIEARTKSSKSLKEKIYRKNYFCKYSSAKELIEALSDGIGVRISCLLTEDEEKIYRFIMNHFTSEETIYNKSFFLNNDKTLGLCNSEQPEVQKNGLPIYRIDGVVLFNDKYIRFELQIKSLVHYLWGEVEHSLFYKKYDYIISNSYYAQLMKSINNELENVDSQICSLKAHMEQKDFNQARNVREIAAYVLSKQFQEVLSKEIGCEIDLREVFDLIVDLNFLLVSNTEDSLDRLNHFVQNVTKSADLHKYYEIIEKGKLNSGMIMPVCKDIANMIAKNIADGDIFWKSLVTVVAAISEEKDFSICVNNLANKLRGLLLAHLFEVDNVENEKIADDLTQLTQLAVIDAACMVNKIGFFSINNNLSRMKEKLDKVGTEIQNLVAKNCCDSIFDQNKNTIKHYLSVIIVWISGTSLSNTNAIDVANSFINRNDYSLRFSSEIFEWICKNLDKDTKSKLEESFDKEANE